MEEIDNLLTKIKDQTLSLKAPDYFGTSGASMPISNISNTTTEEKLRFSEITPYSENTVYATLNDKSKVSMYENFIPGTDNQERLAQNQTAGEKWGNGITKALAKTGNAVIGGTAGIIYGVGAAIEEGSLSALYDNSFSNTLNDWDVKLNYQLPNYYTKQEQEKGFFGQTATANFWSDKVLGGLSFTAGAIVSEGIWAWATGGTSLATSAARLGTKALNFTKGVRWSTEALGEAGALTALARNKSFLKQAINTSFEAGNISKQTAIALGKTTDVLNTSRFMLTSAGYESSVEALQYKKEAEERFYNNFSNINGREPNAQDISEFNKNLESSANAVFGVNMAIVGSSNLVTMGKLFELKNPINTGIGDFIEKKAFGYGVAKGADGTYDVLKATKGQRIARNIFAYGKAPVTEGLYEEGFQGITNKTANRWIDHTYNDKYATETFDMAGGMYDSFAEQYGTKEGWVENGVGMIIGALGGSINTRSQQKAKDQQLELQKSGLNTFTTPTLQQSLIPKKVQLSNQIAGFSEEAKTEAQKGNIVRTQLANEGVLHAFLNHKYALGEDFNDAAKEIKIALDTATADQFKAAGVQPSEIDQYKEDTLNNFIAKSKQFKQNRTYAEYMVGRNRTVGEKEVSSILGDSFKGVNTNEALIQSLTWVLTEGESANKYMQDIQGRISDEVGTEQSTTLSTISKLRQSKSNKQGQVTKAVNQQKALTTERDKLTKTIAKLNNAPKETEGDKTRGNALEQANLRLLELTDKITELDTQLSTYADELNKSEVYGQGLSDLNYSQNISGSTISANDLLSLNENVEKFQSLIQSLKESNPQRAQYLEDLLDEHAQAEDIFLTNQKTAMMLSSGEMKLEKINTWMGKRLKGNKSMDEATKEWLTEILNKYESNILENVGKEEVTPVTTEVVDNKEIKPKQVVAPPSEAGMTPIQIYKQRIENMLKKGYNNLSYLGENYDGVANKKPTEEEINRYRELKANKQFDAEYKTLLKKLQDWKLLDSATDAENNSIAELIDLIDQLEQTIEQDDTQVEITQDETILISDEIGSSGDVVDYDLLQNVRGTVKVKKLSNSNNLRFSHLKIATLLNRLGQAYEVTLKGKPAANVDLDNPEAGTTFTVDNTDFIIGNGGTIEVDANKFQSLQQALSIFLVNTNDTNWSYKDVYEFNGADFVKLESDFAEDIDPQAIYDLNEGDTLSLEIKEDGWNQKLLDKVNRAKTDKAREEAMTALKSQLKIFAVDSQGRRVSTLKSSREGAVNPTLLQLREEAAKRYLISHNKEEVKLGITTKVKNVYLGSPELQMTDGQVNTIPFTAEAISQVEATGYMEGEQVETSKTFTSPIDTTFIRKIAKNNGGKKVPFVVISKGVHKIAYPISLIAKEELGTKGLVENTLSKNITPQQQIQEINNNIQKFGIKTEKLVYADINNPDKIQDTIEAFNNKETYVSMEEFASNKYKKENLTNNATINIDLENLDKAISDAKVRIDLNDLTYTAEKEVKISSQIEIENELNELAVEIYDDFVNNADTKYIDSKGNILEDTNYSDTLDDEPIIKTKSNLQKIKNIKILEQAFTGKLPKIVIDVLGQEKVEKIKELLETYNFIKSQIVIKPEIIASGKNQTKC